MAQSTIFFCGLDKVRFSFGRDAGLQLQNDFFLTNNRSVISRVVSPYTHSIGTLEHNWLVNKCPAVIYKFNKFLKSEDIDSQLTVNALSGLLFVQDFLLSLWTKRDNAVYHDRAWSGVNIDGNISVHSNVWNIRNSNSQGGEDVVAFVEEDIRVSKSPKRSQAGYIGSNKTPTMLTSDSLRIQRFLYFIQIARSSFDLAIKIVQYCSALETLLSRAPAELSHQVSERASSALEGPGENRVKLFRDVKEAYNFRSKAVHGASFDGNAMNKLKICSEKIDSICRRLLIKYLDSDNEFASAVEGSEEKLSTFFIDRILGGK